MKFKLRLYVSLICVLITLSVLLTSCNTVVHSGIVDAEINENGELIVVYDDGSQQNLGVVVGASGADGANGLDGSAAEKGEKGENGKNGVDGADGSLVITSDGSSIPAASAKGLRSAVSIACTFTATVQQGGYRPGTGGSTEKEYSSAGSGVIYKLDRGEGDAFIITNYHVVYDASSNSADGISNDIKVYLYGSEIESKAIEATYVGGSLYYDIAVLRIEDSQILSESDACAVTVADSDLIRVGDSSIAIGNAQGYGTSVSAGVVCVDSEYIDMTAADGKTTVSFRVMRIDSAVNSGNSGGGLYNDKGELIGIVNAKIVDDTVENIGYAIPSKVAISVADNVIDYCFGTSISRVQRAVVGISVTVSDSKAVYDSNTGDVSIEETVSVYSVTSGSLADGVMKTGDVLVSAVVNGKTIDITRQYHVIDLMLDMRVGNVITFNVIRSGVATALNITVTQGCLVEY